MVTRGGRKRFAFWRLALICSSLLAKNSPQDCFLNARTLSGFDSRASSRVRYIKKIFRPFLNNLVTRGGSKCFAFGMFALVCSHLFAKNSPPDCFLNAQTLSGFDSALLSKFNISKSNVCFYYLMVTRGGIEPPLPA